ncbi:MAG: ATP-binding protein [Patescibacteria group bacterium]
MSILDKNLSEITFKNIEEFCAEGIPEGIQLDYKLTRPEKGFSKHFAGLSNQKGGLIILGIDEDRNTGIPKAWVGIKKDGKLLEQIHHDAANVDPFPEYDIHYTDEVDGHVFLLIRIFEGSQTPYYVFNDSNLWVRTGNIRKPIDLANPKQAEILFNKREKAIAQRNILLRQADYSFDNGLHRAELERLTKISEKQDGQASIVYGNTLGEKSSICKVYLLPYYPNINFATPQDLLVFSNELNERPSREFETIPYGIFQFIWSQYNGYVECCQLFSKGLIYYYSDVLTGDYDTGGKIELRFVAGAVHRVINLSKKYFQKYLFTGSLIGGITLSDVRALKLFPIKTRGIAFDPGELKTCLLPDYHLEMNLTSQVLFSQELLNKWYFKQIKEIYISLGLRAPSDLLLESFCKENDFTF